MSSVRHIEHLVGVGTLVRHGEAHRIEYEIDRFQSMTDVGGGREVPGLGFFQGHALPVVDIASTDILHMQLQDGRIAEFFWTDSEGTITVNGISEPA